MSSYSRLSRRVSYGKKKVIADIPFPGASSKIPGIATIGPQLVVKGGINARLSMSGTVETKLQIAKWNVSGPSHSPLL